MSRPRFLKSDMAGMIRFMCNSSMARSIASSRDRRCRLRWRMFDLFFKNFYGVGRHGAAPRSGHRLVACSLRAVSAAPSSGSLTIRRNQTLCVSRFGQERFPARALDFSRQRCARPRSRASSPLHEQKPTFLTRKPCVSFRREIPPPRFPFFNNNASIFVIYLFHSTGPLRA